MGKVTKYGMVFYTGSDIMKNPPDLLKLFYEYARQKKQTTNVGYVRDSFSGRGLKDIWKQYYNPIHKDLSVHRAQKTVLETHSREFPRDQKALKQAHDKNLDYVDSIVAKLLVEFFNKSKFFQQYVRENLRMQIKDNGLAGKLGIQFRAWQEAVVAERMGDRKLAQVIIVRAVDDPDKVPDIMKVVRAANPDNVLKNLVRN